MNNLVREERVGDKIFTIRGQKVMIDSDLAKLYGVRTKNLNKAVRRNLERFPSDFMFQITKVEYDTLRFQFGTLKKGAHSKYLPFAFTEQGISMLSSVLRSKKAVEVNIVIMRAFVRIRRIINNNKDLSYLFKELKHKVDQHDTEIGLIIKTIERMITTDKKPKTKMGFIVGKYAIDEKSTSTDENQL